MGKVIQCANIVQVRKKCQICRSEKIIPSECRLEGGLQAASNPKRVQAVFSEMDRIS